MSTNGFVAHPRNVDALTRYGACNGVFEQDLPDFVAEVQTRALEYVEGNEPPKDREGWEGLLIRIARNYLVDRCEKRKTAKKWDAGLCEIPDEIAPPAAARAGEERDPVDAKRQLTVLLEMLEQGEMPERGRQILEGIADGMKIPAIGREVGLPASEVRNRLSTMRRRYFKRLHMLGLMMLIVGLFALFMGGPAGVGQGRPDDGDAGTGTPEQDAAAQIREEALRACDEGKWQECEEGLDRAKGVDPAGEEEAKVQMARERLARSEAEPGRGAGPEPR